MKVYRIITALYITLCTAWGVTQAALMFDDEDDAPVMQQLDTTKPTVAPLTQLPDTDEEEVLVPLPEDKPISVTPVHVTPSARPVEMQAPDIIEPVSPATEAPAPSVTPSTRPVAVQPSAPVEMPSRPVEAPAPVSVPTTSTPQEPEATSAPVVEAPAPQPTAPAIQPQPVITESQPQQEVTQSDQDTQDSQDDQGDESGGGLLNTPEEILLGAGAAGAAALAIAKMKTAADSAKAVASMLPETGDEVFKKGQDLLGRSAYRARAQSAELKRREEVVRSAQLQAARKVEEYTRTGNTQEALKWNQRLTAANEQMQNIGQQRRIINELNTSRTLSSSDRAAKEDQVERLAKSTSDFESGQAQRRVTKYSAAPTLSQAQRLKLQSAEQTLARQEPQPGGAPRPGSLVMPTPTLAQSAVQGVEQAGNRASTFVRQASQRFSTMVTGGRETVDQARQRLQDQASGYQRQGAEALGQASQSVAQARTGFEERVATATETTQNLRQQASGYQRQGTEALGQASQSLTQTRDDLQGRATTAATGLREQASTGVSSAASQLRTGAATRIQATQQSASDELARLRAENERLRAVQTQVQDDATARAAATRAAFGRTAATATTTAQQRAAGAVASTTSRLTSGLANASQRAGQSIEATSRRMTPQVRTPEPMGLGGGTATRPGSRRP